MSTHTPGYEITFDGFGFNDAKDPYKRRLSTLPATWKDEGARQQFGHEVVRAVNTHAQLLGALQLAHAYLANNECAMQDSGNWSDAEQDLLETLQAAIAAAEGRKD